MEKAQKRASLLLEVTAVTTANSVVTTFSNGSLFPSLGQSDHAPGTVQMDPVLGKLLFVCIKTRLKISTVDFLYLVIIVEFLEIVDKTRPTD